MTATSPEHGEPRWYADPEGGGGLRWWDGTQWTSAVMAPAELGPPVQQPLPAGTTVYTWSIWLMVFLPLVSIAGLLVLPLPSFGSYTDLQSAQELQRSFDLNGLVRNALSFLVWGTSVALAFHDRRTLLRAGYVRPFHWAWAFLYSGVYIIGRSIIVQRRIGRGLAPIWAWVGTSVLGLIVSVGILVPMFADLLAVIPR
ncbi:MAG: DUF2510 domain-containing protein [Cryobacterium sp.]